MSGYVVCEDCGDEIYWEDELPENLEPCMPCELIRARKEIQKLKAELTAQLNISIMCDKELGKRDAEIEKLKDVINDSLSEYSSTHVYHESRASAMAAILPEESKGAWSVKLKKRDKLIEKSLPWVKILKRLPLSGINKDEMDQWLKHVKELKK